MPEAATTPTTSTTATTPTTATTSTTTPTATAPKGDDGELAKARARVAELEGETRQRAEADAESKGQWKELIASKDERITKLASEGGDKDKTIAELRSQMAERDILDGITEQIGGDRKMIAAAYRDLVRTKGLDVVPKDIAAAVKERGDLLTKEYPTLGQAKTTSGGGGSPPPKSGGDPKRKGFPLL